jgi:hypothetical protein
MVQYCHTFTRLDGMHSLALALIGSRLSLDMLQAYLELSNAIAGRSSTKSNCNLILSVSLSLGRTSKRCAGTHSSATDAKKLIQHTTRPT